MTLRMCRFFKILDLLAALTEVLVGKRAGSWLKAGPALRGGTAADALPGSIR